MSYFLSIFRPSLAMLELHVARLRLTYTTLALAGGLALMLVWYFLFVPPRAFPTHELLTIESSQTLSGIAIALEEQQVIHSAPVFLAYARSMGSDRTIHAGKYVFDTPIGLATLLDRLTKGKSDIAPIRVVLFEGMTTYQIADVLYEEIPGFDRELFLAKSAPLEGYLFPDTYFFMPGVSADEVISRMYGRFTEQVATIENELMARGDPFPEVLTMASLLEREGRTLGEKRMIAGILWNRLSRDMPLQVDAVFGYIKKRETYSPSFSDLEIDSAYNTYKHTGLPPGPIANPGLDSLLAAVTPTKTDALYYLTGRDGKMHYAKTFTEHKANRSRYLD